VRQVSLARTTIDAASNGRDPFDPGHPRRGIGWLRTNLCWCPQAEPALLWAAPGIEDIAPLSLGVDSWASTLRRPVGVSKCRRWSVDDQSWRAHLEGGAYAEALSSAARSFTPRCRRSETVPLSCMMTPI